jgi:YD repeat-containing protein
LNPLMPSGQYCALLQDVGANLSYNSGSTTATYTYTPHPGFTLTYNAQGQLTAETDAVGDTLKVAYGQVLPGSGNCPATASWCQTVTAANSRVLTIGYNGANLITSVTDPMGRQWAYSYTGSDLTSATDPVGHVTSYTYGVDGSGNPLNANNLLTTTDPNGQPRGPDPGAKTTNVYDSSGRVIQQTDPLGYLTKFNYCVNAASGNCMNPSTGTGYTTVTDPGGNTAVDGYLAGEMVSTAAYTGGTAMTSEHDVGPIMNAGVANGGSMLTAWATDGNNNVITYQYDPAGHAKSATSPLGSTTSRWSTALGLPSCQGTAMAASPCSSTQTGPGAVAAGGAITPPPSAPPAGNTYELFSTTGQMLYSTAGLYQPGSQTPLAVTDYTLYQGNTVTLNGNQIS